MIVAFEMSFIFAFPPNQGSDKGESGNGEWLV